VSDLPVIAIVDDDASVRRSLLRVVEAAGYKAQTFASGREFRAWLPHGQPACLVLDVHMADLTGFDVYDRLKVPVVFDRLAVLDTIERAVRPLHGRPPSPALTPPGTGAMTA
jgi:FixJ family two-component response regulator